MKMTIERFTLKNLYSSAILTIIVFILLTYSSILCYPDVINLLFSPFKFDSERAVKENLLTVFELNDNKTSNSKNDTDTLLAGLLGVNSDLIINPETGTMFMPDEKYSQSGKYIFSVKPVAIYNISLAYESTLYLERVPIASEMAFEYAICQLDSMIFFVKVPYGMEITTGDTLTGVFFPYSSQEIRDLQETLGGGNSIQDLFRYQLDMTSNFFWDGIWALGWVIACIFFMTWLMIRLVNRILYVEKRPLYRKIYMLTGDVDVIDKELENAIRINKCYKTDNWIITTGLFSTHIDRAEK